jgi:hypothetical protein
MALRAETRLRARGFLSDATSTVKWDVARIRTDSEEAFRWLRKQQEAGRSERERMKRGLRTAVETHDRVMRSLRAKMRELRNNYP